MHLTRLFTVSLHVPHALLVSCFRLELTSEMKNYKHLQQRKHMHIAVLFIFLPAVLITCITFVHSSTALACATVAILCMWARTLTTIHTPRFVTGGASAPGSKKSQTCTLLQCCQCALLHLRVSISWLTLLSSVLYLLRSAIHQRRLGG